MRELVLPQSTLLLPVLPVRELELMTYNGRE